MQDQRLVWLVAGVLVLFAAIGITWWWLRRKGPPGPAEEDRLDTIIGWPPQATRLLTNPERVAFGTLVRALPEYMVLAQVPLARFINVPKRNSYAEWLRRLGNQCVDFLICDMNSQIIAVVDVQLPPAQTSERARRRQTRITRTLKAARVPMHVWFEGSLPPVEVARDTILLRPDAPANLSSAPAPAPIVAGGGLPATPPSPERVQPAFNPFEDTGRDSTQDEFIELQEPPPSTWYDDLDSGPTPLGPGGKRPGR